MWWTVIVSQVYSCLETVLMPSNRVRNAGEGQSSDRSWSIAQLIVVMTLIAPFLLMGLFDSLVIGRNVESRRSKVLADFCALRQAMRMFRIDFKRYPRSFAELLGENSKNGVYIEEMANDPWGRPYIFKDLGGGRFVIICLGAKPGRHEDDIFYGTSMVHDCNLRW